jgi:hypothetical protein
MEEKIQHCIKLTKELLEIVQKLDSLSGYYSDDEASNDYEKDILKLHKELVHFKQKNDVHNNNIPFSYLFQEHLTLFVYQEEKVEKLRKKLESEESIRKKLKDDYYNYMTKYLELNKDKL